MSRAGLNRSTGAWPRRRHLGLLCAAWGLVGAPARAAPAETAPTETTPASNDAAEYQVTVVAPRERVQTASTTHVDARELAAIPRRTAEDALRLVPGLTLVQHGSESKGQQYLLRGFDAAHGSDFEVTVEGIPLNEWSNVHADGYLDLTFLVPEALTSVEVTKGPFALDQGAFATAGSAEYRLGIPERDLGLRTAYTVGTTNRHRGLLTFSPSGSDGSSFVAMEALHDDGFGPRRGVDRGSVLTRLRLFDSPRHGTLRWLAAGSHARFELPGTVRNEDVAAGRIGFYESYDRTSRGRASRVLTGLDYRWERGRHRLAAIAHGGYRRLELHENYTGWLLDPVAGDRRRQTQETWSFGARLVHRWRWSRAFGIDAGLQVRGDVFSQAQHQVVQPTGERVPQYAAEGIQTLASGWIGIRGRPHDAVELGGGVRLDLAAVRVRDAEPLGRTNAPLVAASPRVHLHWRVSPRWIVMAAYGRGFRPPSARAFLPREPVRTGWSEDVAPVRSPTMSHADAWELGTRIQPHRIVHVQASGFVTLVANESIFDHVSGMSLQLNATQRVGAEGVVTLRPLSWLMLRGDVTYVHARFVESRNPIPFAPPWSGSFRAVLTHPLGFVAGLRFGGFSRRPLPHGARGTPYFTADATAGYHRGWFRIDVEVENLLARRLREGEYHYASAWSPGAPDTLPVLHFSAGPPIQARFTFSAIF